MSTSDRLAISASRTTSRNITFVVDRIVERYCDPKLSLARVAGEVGVSRAHLSRLFNGEMGVSFRTYLRLFRIRRALQLFSDSPTLSLKEIAACIGFSDTSAMDRAFRRVLLKPPTVVRGELTTGTTTDRSSQERTS